MNEPDTRYAQLGSSQIAFQVLGDGPIDVIATSSSFGSMDAEWEQPEIAAFLRQVSEFCRMIRYDGLGSGASDPVPLDALPPIESAAEELIAVMDAASSERAVLVANSGSVPVALVAAATWPDRFSGLVLIHAVARMIADEDYPEGISPDEAQMLESMFENWDVDQLVDATFPGRANDERFLKWGRRYLRSIASPGAFRAFVERLINTDVRAVLPLIQTPTLVLHRAGYKEIPMSAGRYVADGIVGAEFVELPGNEGTPWFDHPDALISAIREFMETLSPTALRKARAQRVMATVLFTDIVQSTERAHAMGDAKWHRMLDLHSDISQRCVEEQFGRLIKTTGDGILATFDGPGRALLCASTLVGDLDRVGLPIRTGLHSGEVEVLGEDIGGMAVHIAARIMAAAGTGEVWVSRTVRDLVVGSAFDFEDRGVHDLKGVEGQWQIYSLV